jgi:hypothetical protein
VARVDALLVVGERGNELHRVVLDTSGRRRGRSQKGLPSVLEYVAAKNSL